MNLRQMMARKQYIETLLQGEKSGDPIWCDQLRLIEHEIEHEKERLEAQIPEPLYLTLRPQDFTDIVRSGLKTMRGLDISENHLGDIISVTEQTSPWGRNREPTRVFLITIERKKPTKEDKP